MEKIIKKYQQIKKLKIARKKKKKTTENNVKTNQRITCLKKQVIATEKQ